MILPFSFSVRLSFSHFLLCLGTPRSLISARTVVLSILSFYTEWRVLPSPPLCYAGHPCSEGRSHPITGGCDTPRETRAQGSVPPWCELSEGGLNIPFHRVAHDHPGKGWGRDSLDLLRFFFFFLRFLYFLFV